MIDWAIDGMMEVEGAGVFNRLQDAKTEFHYQLFRSEHRSYYNAQDIEILDECKTAANVGWLHSLVGVSLSKKHRPPVIKRSSLAEIDISKAYTGAFMQIKAIPVFNEFGAWQAYKPEGADQEHEPLYSGGELLRPLLQQEIQLVLRLLPEATEATTLNKSREAPEHHQIR